ncbi:MAG: metallophosphoesterase [Paludibacteraceae bacterium]|nr:metallophosphoesterase [Paludibacteraceae bacterium]
MKRFLFLLTFSAAVLCASASNRYISPTGNDGDGKSWANAKTNIAAAIWDVGKGDTMFIAQGVYNERLSAQDGATYLGGYNAETGERDIELYETILDGTGLTEWLLVKYGGNADNVITIDGLVFQNANHSTWGGAALYCRGGMVVSNCVFRDCVSGSKAGGIFVDETAAGSSALIPAVIRGCIFENCSCTLAQQAGAIHCESSGAFIVENCIIRGCQGGVMISANAEATVRNCLIYNNQVDYNGALYGKGTFINNTVCNNQGVEGRYAGCRVEGKAVNNVFWGNVVPNGTATNQNYLASGAGSTNNIADTGSGMSTGLAADNNAADGPNFRNPTGFIGKPKTDVEKEVVRKADFSLTDASTKLVDKGTSEGAPEKDIAGVARPKGNGYDIGAYEYDPEAVIISVTGVSIVPESIEIIEGKTGTLMAQVEPADANNKRVDWSIDNEAIATIKNGKVTGITPGTTTARVKTQDGEFTAAATVIIKEKPPVRYPQEVLDAEALYKMEDYTVPSYIKFLVPKTAAKIDSLDDDNKELLPTIAGNLEKMNEAIANLQVKQMPYNQIATIYGDPATHMGFCWFTNGGITEGKVQLIAKANATAEDFETCDCVITVNAQTKSTSLHYTPIQASESPKYDICTAAGLPRNTKFDYVSHKAQATELTPGTVYSWRVGFGEYWSEIAQFVTKDANQGDFSFLYMSDSHIQDYEYINEAYKCAYAVAKNEPDAKFCLFPGDFADTGGDTNSEWQWEQWFDGSMRPALNKMAFVPTDGNHDDSKSLNYDYHFNTDWSFASMAETKPQFQGITYSFVYGDVLFLVYSLQDWWRTPGTSEEGMQSSYLSVDVRNWFLDQIEKYPNTKYRVTVSHKNIFSGAGHHTDDECPLLRNMMLPIFKECEIDLAIQGHDHCYEVMGPVDPDTRKVVEGAVADVESVAVNTNTNMTGKSGGEFTTDDGTLYFIGATCGRKRYYPYSEQKMIDEYTEDPAILFDYKHHNVKDLFSLFTSRFGQPGSPSYSRFNVSDQGIEVVTYKTDDNGNKEEFNTINIKRTKPHGTPTGCESLYQPNVRDGEKFIRDGQVFIQRDGKIYNVLGENVK